MYTALDISGKRVFIDDADKGKMYYCPACNAPMIIKRGEIVTAHFAHKGRKNCDLWQFGEMSEWHKEMQSLFPLECQEVVIRDEDLDESHIADAFVQTKRNGVVFEFQHSTITKREFIRRSLFYIELGHAVIWVFDLQDETAPKKIFYTDYYYDDDDALTMRFVWPSRDIVHFLDDIQYTPELYESIDSGWLKIVLHICTGHGREDYHTDANGRTWSTWHYSEILPYKSREFYFVIPKKIHQNGIKDFTARCYTEEEFFKKLRTFAYTNRPRYSKNE